MAATVAAVAGIAGPGSRDEGPASLARSFSQSGDPQRAAQTLRAAFRAAPTEALRLDLASALIVAGDHRGALDILAATSPDQSIEYQRGHLRVETLIRSKVYADAEREARALLVMQPQDSRATLALARVAYGRGDHDGAKARLAEAIRLGGGALAEAWLFRSRIALHENQLETARSAVARAASAGAHPDETDGVHIEAMIRAGAFDAATAAIGGMGRAPAKSGLVNPQQEYLAAALEMARGRYDDAARRLRDIEGYVVVQPYGDLFCALARTRAGDEAQGAALLAQALAAAPRNAVVMEAAARSGAQVKDIVAAEHAASRLAALDPARGAAMRLALARRLRKWDEVLAFAKSAARYATPDSPESMMFGPASAPAEAVAKARAQNHALIAAARTGLDGSAAETIAAARSIEGDDADPAALGVAGELYLAADADDAASHAFERALARAPHMRAAIEGRLRIAVRSGDLASAERDLRAAAATEAFAVTAQARVLAAQGEFAKAVSLLRSARATLDDDAQALRLFAHVLQRLYDVEGLITLARSHRRARPLSPVVSELLAAAGLPEEAADAAREAFLSAPDSAERGEDYALAMRRIGRIADAEAFLMKLARGRDDRSGIEAAHRRLAADPGEDGVEAVERNITLAAARRAYFERPGDPGAARLYGAMLAPAGRAAAALRVMREACFWGSTVACAETVAGRS